MKALAKIRHAISARIPGTAANVAEQKRRMERELRAQGYGRGHAKAEVAKRFNRG